MQTAKDELRERDGAVPENQEPIAAFRPAPAVGDSGPRLASPGVQAIMAILRRASLAANSGGPKRGLTALPE